MSASVSVRKHLRREPRIARAKTLKVSERDIGRPHIIETSGGGRAFVRFSGQGGGGAGGAPLGGKNTRMDYVIGADTVRENAMDNLDDLLGFKVVPPTYIRATDIKVLNERERSITKDAGKPYEPEPRLAVSVQEIVPNARPFETAMGEAERHAKAPFGETDTRRELFKRIRKEDLIKIAILDYIALNTDRHSHNIIYNPETKHAYGIDHELTFEPYENMKITRTFSLAWKRTEGERIPKKVFEALKSVSKEDFFAALAGMPIEKIRRAWRRKESLERKIMETGRMPFKSPPSSGEEF